MDAFLSVLCVCRTGNENGSTTRRANAMTVPESTEARQKFGGAKAISSEMFAGGRSADEDYKDRLVHLQGQKAISSAELFGTGGEGDKKHAGGSGGSSALDTPDLDDIKDSLRQGVSKVASKLSTLANGVVSSFQVSSSLTPLTPLTPLFYSYFPIIPPPALPLT